MVHWRSCGWSQLGHNIPIRLHILKNKLKSACFYSSWCLRFKHLLDKLVELTYLLTPLFKYVLSLRFDSSPAGTQHLSVQLEPDLLMGRRRQQHLHH